MMEKLLSEKPRLFAQRCTTTDWLFKQAQAAVPWAVQLSVVIAVEGIQHETCGNSRRISAPCPV